MIEEWVTDDVAAGCELADHAPHNEELWDNAVRPYLDMTVRGWVWYQVRQTIRIAVTSEGLITRRVQGENNCGTLHGNSATKSGCTFSTFPECGFAVTEHFLGTHSLDGCLMPALIALWRRAWSVVPGTTAKDAPFGLVTLSTGDSEGAPDIASFRWSQTGNYGVVPNPIMPATFLAHAYDLEDVWSGENGAGVKCNASTVRSGHCSLLWVNCALMRSLTGQSRVSL